MKEINTKLKNFLIEYECNTDLFDFILICKDKLTYRFPDYFIEPIKIETSIKKMNDGRILKGRYIIALSLAEFDHYDEIDKYKIFSIIGFDINKFKKFLNYTSLNPDQTIYIGFDNHKGKIYFEEFNGNIIAFETTGLIKYYKLRIPHIYDIITSASNNKVIAQHIRMNTNNGLNWISFNNDYMSIYFRPDIEPDTNDNLFTIFLSYWFKHNCSEFYKKYNLKRLQ